VAGYIRVQTEALSGNSRQLAGSVEQLRAMVSAMMNSATGLENTIQSVRAAVDQVLTQWDSSHSSGQYQAVMAKWNRNTSNVLQQLADLKQPLNNLTGELGEISGAVAQAGVAYADTDGQIRSSVARFT
jgi:uncharacterized protein YukE